MEEAIDLSSLRVLKHVERRPRVVMRVERVREGKRRAIKEVEVGL